MFSRDLGIARFEPPILNRPVSRFRIADSVNCLGFKTTEVSNLRPLGQQDGPDKSKIRIRKYKSAEDVFILLALKRAPADQPSLAENSPNLSEIWPAVAECRECSQAKTLRVDSACAFCPGFPVPGPGCCCFWLTAPQIVPLSCLLLHGTLDIHLHLLPTASGAQSRNFCITREQKPSFVTCLNILQD